MKANGGKKERKDVSCYNAFTISSLFLTKSILKEIDLDFWSQGLESAFRDFP